jgi:hypothetical protein
LIPLPDIDSLDTPAEQGGERDGFELDTPQRRRTATTAQPPRGELFAEDFDDPKPDPAEPKIVEPVFSLAEIEAARAEAWRAGQDAERQSQAHHDAEATRAALAAIALQLDIASAEAEATVRTEAAAAVGLLLDALGVAFPGLRARFGPDETEALLRAVLPTLRAEPRATLRLPPHLQPRLSAVIATADPELSARLSFIPDPALAPDELHVSWHAGEARRDVAGAWSRIEDVLGQAGWPITHATKEIAYVE